MANINDKKDTDMYNLEMWKKTGDKTYFQNLYRDYGGLLNEASRKASMGSNVPKSVFKLEAAQLFHDLVKRYDPTKAQLNTYIYSSVQDKLKRVGYKYQNLGRMAERSVGGVAHLGILKNEREMLRHKLNREPSSLELAEALGWSLKQVETLLSEDRRDLSLNAELEDLNVIDDGAEELAFLEMHYYDMDPQEQLIYDYATGSHGKKALLKPNGKDADFDAIARSSGIPKKDVLNIRKRLVSRLSKR